MNRISAAGNLTIEMNPENWRLIANGGGQEQILLEASPGQPLRYLPVFAQKRRLPESGALAGGQIQRVVLGWSQQDEAWHLGLMLDPELAQARGSRWCEIARWPDPDTTVFGDIANRAGRSLATTLQRPFNYLPPQPIEAAPPPPPPLPELPLHFDQWTLQKTDALEFVRAPGWTRARLLRMIWYGLLVIVYAALSLLTLQGKIALPKPEFLPYLGLAVAALLAGAVLYTAYQLLAAPDRIRIDSTRAISGRRGSSQRWRLEAADYQAVYVTQVIGKKGKQQIAQYGEINLLLVNGGFRHLISTGESPEPLQGNGGGDLLIELKPEDVHTDLQAAGLHMAQALGVPCWYDRRGK
ncbi:MAG: hypothetical protein BroJett038_00180 [Chloroflexota bacterium]|nr:MAG: hypothetical protein BroJett038_00180 [Chloroflexota bacterium]